MDKNDLKSMWQEVHNADQGDDYNKVNIEKSIILKHSKTISKVLSDVKLKIIGYILVLILLIGLMIYALIYLGLNFSVNSLVLFSFIGLFFLIKTISEINRLIFLTTAASKMSVKDSLIFFRKKLIRIKTIDFLSYLFYFYTLAIWSAYSYINNIGGVKNLSWGNAMQQLMLIVILMILLIPWLIKYQYKQQYKKLYSNLNHSVNLLDENQ